MSTPDDADPAEVSRSDLKLYATAIRQDWPIPPQVKTRLLQVAINLADPDDLGPNAGPEALSHARRTQLAALKVVAGFCKLTLEQQRLDLAKKPDPNEGRDRPRRIQIPDADARSEPTHPG